MTRHFIGPLVSYSQPHTVHMGHNALWRDFKTWHAPDPTRRRLGLVDGGEAKQHRAPL